MLNNIIRCLPAKSFTEFNQKRFNWLKSLPERFNLQPKQKWSKEQIGALDYAYCELFKRGDVGHNILGPLQKLCDELRNSNHEEIH